MEQPPSRAITELLRHARSGQVGAADALLETAYLELGAVARAQLARERNGHTLQPTALVHEVWLKLADNVAQASDRTHFFAIASRVMRRVLTDHARARNSKKRSAGGGRVALDAQALVAGERPIEYLDLEEALAKLEALNERHARVVELRVLGGLTIEETAAQLDVSVATIERDWSTARAWLRVQLSSPT